MHNDPSPILGIRPSKSFDDSEHTFEIKIYKLGKYEFKANPYHNVGDWSSQMYVSGKRPLGGPDFRVLTKHPKVLELHARVLMWSVNYDYELSTKEERLSAEFRVDVHFSNNMSYQYRVITPAFPDLVAEWEAAKFRPELREFLFRYDAENMVRNLSSFLDDWAYELCHAKHVNMKGFPISRCEEVKI